MTEIPHLPKAVVTCSGDAILNHDEGVDQLTERLIAAHRSLCRLNGLLPIAPSLCAEETLNGIEVALSSLGIPADYQDRLACFSDDFKEVTGRRPRYNAPEAPMEILRWYETLTQPTAG